MTSPRFCSRCATPLVSRTADGRDRMCCPAEGCGFIHYGNPVPVVAAIVQLDGDVILVRNKGWPETWFGLVSGFLEAGESPADGVLREVREELSLTGRVESLVGAYGFEERNELIIAYHVVAQGTPVAGEELAAFKRVPVEKLRPWPMATGMAVRDWLASRNPVDERAP